MRALLVGCGRLRSIVLATGLLLVTAAGWPQEEPRYHNHEQLTRALQRLVREHSSLARMESLAKTLEGRDVWMVELANRTGTPLDDRPALLVVANLEGDHVVGSELALATVQHFLTSYESDTDVKHRLDEHVVYVFPRLNPDAAERMFASVREDWKRNLHPFDDDNDARTDEDGPDDLNGDGVITLMRVPDPAGDYVVHPDEPRLLKAAEPHKGEAGRYAVYIEGLDNDGDGFYNEDGTGGVDLNRNFQHAYPYYTPDAGQHMVSEPESRALMDFVIAHRNIAMVLTFGESDNLVTAPESNGRLAAPKTLAMQEFANSANSEARSVGMISTRRQFGFGFGFGGFRRGQQQQPQTSGRGPRPQRPDSTVNRADVEYFRAVSEKYRELTGIKEVATSRAPAGAFFEYAYYQFGVPAFSTPGWGLPEAARGERADTGEAEPPQPAARRPTPSAAGAARAGPRPGATSDQSTEVRLLQWMDQHDIDGFVEWQTVQHPDLGQVEVGGFKPYATTNPPAGELAALGEAHGKFTVYLMSLFGDVGIANTDVTNHGAGVFEITAEIENTGFLPTAMQQGVRARSVPAVMVQLDVLPENVITGAAKTSLIPSLNGSGAREEFSWFVRGSPGDRVQLRVRTTKSGLASATITLR